MTTKDAFSLKKGDIVFHVHYGDCIVNNVIRDFGPTIIPKTGFGYRKYFIDSGMNVMPPNCPYLCSDYKRNLKHSAYKK